jgi:thiol-disulfide isomerase/thioredoxin
MDIQDLREKSKGYKTVALWKTCGKLVLLLGMTWGLGACRDAPKELSPSQKPSGSSSQATTSSKSSKLQWVAAGPTGDAATVVRHEQEQASKQGRKLLVYVGAKWCEPCRYFHNAALAGELDSVFGNLRVLEFDLDRDKERLVQAGYKSRLIPLFALAAKDGTFSGKMIQGSIKGPGAVEEITPRLQGLLVNAE